MGRKTEKHEMKTQKHDMLAILYYLQLSLVSSLPFIYLFFKSFLCKPFFKSLYPICYNVASILYFGFFVHESCGILVPQPGIETAPSALEVWSLNRWTAREVLNLFSTNQKTKIQKLLSVSQVKQLVNNGAKILKQVFISTPRSQYPLLISFFS